MFNRLRLLFRRVPNRYFDPETDEEFLRIPPVRRNIGVNLRPIYLVNAKDVEEINRRFYSFYVPPEYQEDPDDDAR